MSDSRVEANSDVYSEDDYADSYGNANATQTGIQIACRGEPASYVKDWNLISGEPEQAAVAQGISLEADGSSSERGGSINYSEADGSGMTNVGW